MCGIAGIVSSPPWEPQSLRAPLERMLTALRHRGPDDEGLSVLTPPEATDSAVLLAHTRLAILDPSPAGHQPMHDAQTGNCIVFNGEIYNFKHLRAELNGEPWHSRSDTEVLLRAYHRWGSSFVERLRGMFAFALWDATRKQLILGRDPFGIKPLYYSISGDQLVFASELRALLASNLVSGSLCPDGLSSYLSFGSVEEPLTILRDVRSLPAGHLLVAEVKDQRLAVSVKQHSEPLDADPCNERPQSAELLREVLLNSVAAHLVSDVPVAAFLSGGIDSSAVVALMSRVADEPPRTFSVVFAEEEFSEGRYARMVAERCDAEHTEIPLSETQLLGMLPEALRAMDQPTMDGINTYVVSGAVRQQGIKVALSGLGGDELFGGYPSFARVQRAQWLDHVPLSLRRKATRLTAALAGGSPRAMKAAHLLTETDARDVYLLSRRLFDDRTIGHLLLSANGSDPSRSKLPALAPGFDPFLAVCIYELSHYMRNTLLRDTDCMSMAHSLEVRVPFIDRDVVAAALAVPSEHKINRTRPKTLLLDALGDLLPQEVWARPKMGFTLPFERWMRSSLRPEIDAVLLHSRRWDELGVRSDAPINIWRGFLQHPRSTGWSRPWALYVLAKWCDINNVRTF
jgi:asparagine synthase (glutamine-hydrolysing)